MAAVASSLSTFHHELILRRYLDRNTLTFLFSDHLISNALKIKQELCLETTFTESGARLSVLDQFFDVGVLVTSEAAIPTNSASLLNEE